METDDVRQAMGMYQGIIIISRKSLLRGPNLNPVFYLTIKEDEFTRDVDRGYTLNGKSIYKSRWLDEAVDLETIQEISTHMISDSFKPW